MRGQRRRYAGIWRVDPTAVDVLRFLLSLDPGSGNAIAFQFIALAITMFLAVLLGMGMPAVPAYINAALMMGPLWIGVGIATFTAHMSTFYFAVASAITPPVALAALAAATITKAEPRATGFSAVRSGIVMFVIPSICQPAFWSGRVCCLITVCKGAAFCARWTADGGTAIKS